MFNLQLCKYKNIFGKPGEGAHSYRIFNIAIVDVIFTLFFALIISKLAKFSFTTTCIVLFSLGIILHRLFCVNTTVNNLITKL